MILKSSHKLPVDAKKHLKHLLVSTQMPHSQIAEVISCTFGIPITRETVKYYRNKLHTEATHMIDHCPLCGNFLDVAS